MTSRRRGAIPFLASAMVLAALVLAPAAAAHGGVTVGAYELEVAWRIEPATVGQSNAVQVSITNTATEQPVADLAAGDLTVTISPGGGNGSTVPLVAAGTGAPGTYEGAFVPAAVGAYAFHLTGSIHGTAVDTTFQNSVDSVTAEEAQGLDPLVIVAGAAILLVVAAMAFLLFRVKPASR